MFFHIFATHIKDQIPVNNISILINSDAAIRISIVCKSDIQTIFFYIFLEHVNMCRAAVCVDIGSIRLIIDHISFCSKCIKYAFGNT